MEVLGFELNAKNSNYVGEGNEIFGTKPYLFTTNLYSCVGLYAMSGDIRYLGHILVLDKGEFRNGKTEKVFDMFDDLSRMKIEDTIFVGLVYGVSLDEYQKDKYHIISDNLDYVVGKLQGMGLDVERQEDLESENIVIDGVNRTLDTDYEQLDFRLDKVK